MGQSFLEAGYVDEAIETLGVQINDYQVRGDDISNLALGRNTIVSSSEFGYFKAASSSVT